MFELFRNAPEILVGVTKPPVWPYIQNGIDANINKVMTYHRLYPKAVRSNHFLVRLLQMINVPKSLELERYYASVDAMALNTSMMLKMTSPIYKGAFHKGIFYGGDNPEILLATDDYFDFNEADSDWENVCAVTPLLHPKSDMDIHLPNGESYSNERGLAVMLINVTMLAVQYRAFCRAQRTKEFSKSIMQFIGGYVIPNMLKRQTELCFFNRLMNRFYNLDDGKNVSFRSHSFTMINYDAFIDNAIVKVIGNIKNSSQRFDVALRHIPSFYYDDIYDVLLMPDIAPTLQVSWLIIMTRLKVVSFLFDVCRENLRNRNQFVINEILRSFRQNNAFRMLNIMLPDDLYFEAQGYIDNILDSVNRNEF